MPRRRRSARFHQDEEGEEVYQTHFSRIESSRYRSQHAPCFFKTIA